MHRVLALLCLLILLAPVRASAGQQAPPSLQRLSGLRLSNHQGSFKAAAYLPDGTIVLLYDQGDGLRLIKTDAEATSVLAEAQTGHTGDSGLALCTDASGSIYVAGTSSSGNLAGTSGAAFPAAVDTSLNSFLAKFDSNLKPLFLTFLGMDRSAVTGLAISGDGLFATGVTYSGQLPATAGALQTTPPTGNTGAAFVERFTLDGSSLRYATYLGGPDSGTTPTSITVDDLDNAYVAGSTSSPTFPTVAALQPAMLGTVSGFLSKVSPSGDHLAFSTYLAGSGITGLVRDATTSTLLVTGNLALGRFPVTTVAHPIANTPYQTLLRLSEDGQSLQTSVLLFPGTQSSVSAGLSGDAWITGPLPVPITQGEQHAGLGDSYVVHLAASGSIDRATRVGGTVTDNVRYAAMTSTIGAAAVRSDGISVLLPGTVSIDTDATLVTSQTFDFGLSPETTAAFPDRTSELLPPVCATGQSCGGTGAFLGLLGSVLNQATLTLSTEDFPNLIIRNVGTISASGLTLSSNGFQLVSDCTPTLDPGEQCGALVLSSGQGSISVSAANASSQTLSLASVPGAVSQALAISATELDFGFVTSASPVNRSFTVTNLGSTVQTFASTADGVPSAAPYTMGETATTCAGPPDAHVVSAGASCSVTVSLSASPLESNDGPVQAAWKIGARDLHVTGFTQAALLSLSASEIDFGPQTLAPAARLPRFLYLSNASTSALAHTPVTLSQASPFGVVDNCPSILNPQSVCQLALTYLQTATPALDSTTLSLDEGLTVLLTGATTAPAPSASPLAISPLQVSPASIQFTSNVPVSALSSETQVVQITNVATTALPVEATLLGDFTLSSSCGGLLQPNAICAIALRFAPSQAGIRQGSLSVSAGGAYQGVSVSLTGNATPLIPLGPTLDLGETTVGEPDVRWVQVQGLLPALLVSVDSSSFGVAILADNGNGHGTLPSSAFVRSFAAPCVNCWIGIQFLPGNAGSAESDLRISSDAGGNAFHVALRGVGLSETGLRLSPSQTNFGGIPVNSSSALQRLTLTNLLPGTTTANNISVTTAGDFAVVPDSQNCAGTLVNTAACAIGVIFTPSAQGKRTGTLTVSTSAGSISTTLSGTGTPDPGLALAPSALEFDSAGQRTVLVKNTGRGPITIGNLTSNNAAFAPGSTCQALDSQATCQVSVSYTPQTSVSTGYVTVPVRFVDASGQSSEAAYAISVTGSATAANNGLSIFPTQTDFGTAPAGSLGPLRQFSLTNTSSAPLTVDIAASRSFPLAALADCGLLAPGATCTFDIVFDPATAGSLSGSVIATATAQDGTRVAQAVANMQGFAISSGLLTLSGGGSPQSSLNFGQVSSGQSSSNRLSLTNSGAVPVTIRRLSTTTPFHATNTCGMLASGATCNLTLTYTPTYQVTATASLLPRADAGTFAIESDAASSPQTVATAGTVAPESTTPIGAASLPIFSISRGALTFPDTPPGMTSAESITLLNTGAVPVNFAQILTPPDFPATTNCSALQPATSCTVTVVFTPASNSAEGVHTAVLEILSDAANPLEFVSLLASESVAPLQLSTATLHFAGLAVGSSAQQTLMLQNTSAFPIALGHWRTTGDFSTANGTCPAGGGTLSAGQSCTLLVTFKPTVAGPRNGQLTLSSIGAPQPLGVVLAGLGLAGRLTTDLSSINFGTLPLTTAASQAVRLTNTGNAYLAPIGFSTTGPDASAFIAASTCSPSGLAGGATCTAQVTFAPSHSGPHTATLLVTSSDPAGPVQIALSGTGAQPPGFTLTVNGGSSGAAIISSGSTAAFALMITPQGGYNLPVALSCTPVSAAPNALCSPSGSTVALTDGPASSAISISTTSGILSASLEPLGLFSLSFLVLPWRRRQKGGGRAERRTTLLVLCVLMLVGVLDGCAGGTAVTGAPYTPAGTYTYQVTARSMQGTPLTSFVTLNVTVR